MGNTRDYRAEYGYEPAWDLQREKQENVAAAYYDRLDRKDAQRRGGNA